MRRIVRLLIVLIGAPMLVMQAAGAAEKLDAEIQSLKKDVLELNKDLLLLEEELLFPVNTQVTVFLSLDVGELFQLESVRITIDDKMVASQVYDTREIEALRRGGVQKIYIGNIKPGKHEVVAVFTGEGPQGRKYKRATNYVFEKPATPTYLELKVSDSISKQQPEFLVKQW
ncbi:MAG: AraC family transcriptional regulator [Gammaproteobacteria bacterium]|nr:AraC family transcriptional regulator [Gammaproteobacteria bacterium]